MIGQRLFAAGLVAGGALVGGALAVLLVATGRSQLLANALERLRGDGIEVAVPADCKVTMDGLAVADGLELQVRSRWFQHELEPAVERTSGWVPFQTLRVSALCSDGARDQLSVQYDAQARARILRLATVEVWQSPVGKPGHLVVAWLVPDGSVVREGQILARLAGGGELRAPQDGRLHALTIAGALIETRRPPVGRQKPAEPKIERRLVLERRSGSSIPGEVIFLLLCALLVVGALLPRASLPAQQR